MSSQIFFSWMLLLNSGLLHKSGAQQLRLVNGWDRCAGRVEIFKDGNWGTICDDHFDMNETRVVCKQLDCGDPTTVLGWSYFGKGSGDIMLDDVQCEGDEPFIWNCSHSAWYENNCGHNEDISVICSEAGPQPTDHLLVRLVDGMKLCEGRVEVLYNGTWNTVCDDNWNMEDAEVVCRQSGCGKAMEALRDAYFGEGSGKILLDGVDCYGNETYLGQCYHEGFFNHNCQHKEDAGVRCEVNLTSSTTTPADIGPTMVYTTEPPTSVLAATPPSSTESSVTTASGTLPSPSASIRLAGGSRKCEGRVEVYHQGSWGTVCDDSWDIGDAQVVCRQLNCGEAISAPRDALYGEGSGHILLDEVQCQGNETTLDECSHNGWGIQDCGHKEDASVNCSDTPPSSTERSVTTESGTLPSPSASIRLAGGSRKCEGRVEVYHQGSWGTVCDDSWDIGDAQVVCRQLNCGEAISAPRDALYGEGSGHILLDEVQCRGNETTLDECSHNGWGIQDCGHKEDASVNCSAPTPLPETKVTITSAPTPLPETKVTITSAALITTSRQSTAAPAVTTEASSDPVTLTCWPEKMVAVISKPYIRSKGCSPMDLRLNNLPFRYQLTEDNAVISISYKAHGTRAERTGNVVNYLNTISCSGMSNGIRKTVLIRCICKINQQTAKEETHIVDESDSTGKDQMPNGQLKMNFLFYWLSFSHQIHNVPYFVNVNQNADIRVTMTAYSRSVALFLHNCTAASSANDFKTDAHYMLKDGCSRDPTFTSYYSRNRRTIVFTFKRFTSDHKTIAFMQCSILMCRSNDFRSRCYQGCQHRYKRETSFDSEHVQVLGPFKLE